MVQDDQIRHEEMKDKVEAEYVRRVKKLAKSKLYAGNMFNGINAWAIGVVRYSAGILDWTTQDVKRMDVRMRKILTMNGALHPRSNVDRLYLKRNEGGRGLLSVEECVKAEAKGLWEYINNKEELMLKEVCKEKKLQEEETKADFRKKAYMQSLGAALEK